MLPDEARRAFDGLGVFAGGGTIAAAQAVAGAGAATLAQLARANLVRLADGRFALLETLRSFAQEQLAGAGALADCRAAHARHYTDFARQVFAGLQGDDQTAWMARAIADHDNCLAALRYGRQDLARLAPRRTRLPGQPGPVAPH